MRHPHFPRAITTISLVAWGAFLSPSLPSPDQTAHAGVSRTVLWEMFTDRNVPECVTGENAASEVENSYGPNQTVLLEYHPSTDNLGSTETDSIIHWYGDPGFPVSVFDGQGIIRRGWSGVGRADEGQLIDRLATTEDSPLSISLSLEATLAETTVVAHIEIVDPLPEPNPEVRFVVFEDSVSYLTEIHRFTVRDVLPAETLAVSSPGDTVTIRRRLTIDPSWNVNRVGCAVFVQSPTTKAVFQSAAYISPTRWQAHSVSLRRGTDHPLLLDYDGYWYTLTSDTCRVTNAGTQPDSFKFLVRSELPDSFIFFFCTAGGVCYGESATIYFNPDSSANYVVDVQVEHLPPDFATGRVYFTIQSVGDPSKTRTLEYVVTYVPPPTVLVDANAAVDSMAFWEQSLRRINRPYLPWDLFYHRSPQASEIESVSTILWNGGQSSGLSESEEASLLGYLSNGKKLFLASQDYFLYLPLGGSAFSQQVLHVTFWTQDVGCAQATGVPSDAIGDGLTLPMDYGAIGYPDWSDELFSDNSASLVFTNPALQPCGIRYYSGSADSFAVAYLSFPFEAIGDSTLRDTLLTRTLGWLDSPTPTGINEVPSGKLPAGAICSLQNYPNPFRGSTEIRFSIGRSSGLADPWPPAYRQAGLTPDPLVFSLRIYNLAGQLVRAVPNLPAQPGVQSFRWDGTDQSGRVLSSGVYFCRVEGGSVQAARRMVLVR